MMKFPFQGHHSEQTISVVVIDILKIKRYISFIIGHEPAQVADNKIKKILKRKTQFWKPFP